MSREQKEDDMGEIQGVTIFTAPPSEQEEQEQQFNQKPTSLLLLRIEVIKLQLLPYLDNDRGALFDSCRYLRPLKQTEYLFKFNKAASFKYAIDTEFRELVHQSASVNELRSGKRMIKIDLFDNQDIVDVSMLGEVMQLDITCCNGVVDVSALGDAQMLGLGYCNNIANLDVLIRRLIAVLNPTAPAAAPAEMIAYAREYAVFTLVGLACSSQSNKRLIAAEGGIPALIALINDKSDYISVKAKEHAVRALSDLADVTEANQQLIADEGGITSLVAVLTDDSDRSSVKAKEQAALALYNLALGSETMKQQIADEEGCITALVSIARAHSRLSIVSRWYLTYAQRALRGLATDANLKVQIQAAGGEEFL